MAPRILYDQNKTRGTRIFRPYYQTQKPFYITICRPKNPVSRENYASELHQAMILRLSKVGRYLVRTDDRPRSRPVYAVSKYYIPLYEKLKEERFIPYDLDTVLSILPSKYLCYCRNHFLYS